MTSAEWFSVVLDVGDVIVMVALAAVVLRKLIHLEQAQAKRHKTNEELLLSIEEYTRTVRHLLKGEVATKRMVRAVHDALGDDPSSKVFHEFGAFDVGRTDD